MAIATHFGMEWSTLKLLIKGTSNSSDNSRICDIAGLSSPVTVTVLSGSLTTVKLEDIERQKYEADAAELAKNMKAAAERAASATVASAQHVSAQHMDLFDARRDNLNEYVAPIRPTGHVTLDLPLFSNAFLPHGSPLSEHSNLIIMPTNVLKRFTDEEVPFPIILRASRTDKSGKEWMSTHVIPAEYRERINAAYAPVHILRALGAYQKSDDSNASSLEQASNSSKMEVDDQNPFVSPSETSNDGFTVTFSTVKLEKGTMATLQPVEFAWTTRVAEEQQKAVLENQLRAYQCLTVGDTIKIEHERNEYNFEVVALEPKPQVSIVGADLAVDILPPVESPIHQNLNSSLQLSSSTSSSIGSSDKREFSLPLNLHKSQTKFFEFELEDPNLAVLCEVESLEGLAPSLYISTRKPYPTPIDHTWSFDNTATQIGEGSRLAKKLQQTGRRRLLLSQDDPSFSTGRFFLGIYAEWADASFVFRVVVGLKSEISAGFYSSASGLTSGSLLSSSGEANMEIPPNSTRCDHCRRYVPTPTYTMHQLQCARRNFVCPTCNFVGPIAEKEKHQSIAHAIIKCECGFESEAELVALHREFECHLRPFVCPFCDLSMKYGLRSSHLAQCGSRTSTCPICKAWVKNYDMPAHRMDMHPEPADHSENSNNEPTESSSAPQ